MRRVNYLLILAVLTFVSCGKSDRELQAERQAQKAAEREAYQKAYKIAVMPAMDCLPAYPLKDSLLYDTARVDIRLCRFNAQMDCGTAMTGGSVQAAFSDLVRAEGLKHRNRVLMHYLTDTNLNWQLIADKDSKLKQLSDLSDKIVAMTRFSGTNLLTDMAVKKAKPKYQVFRIQVNDVLVRPTMLQNHEIDAYWFAEPQIIKALSTDNNSLFNSEDAGVHLGAVVIMDKVHRQDEEAAFAAAYDKAIEQVNKNGVKYYSALIQKYMKADESVVRTLPDVKYMEIGPPREVDLLMACNFLSSGKVSKQELNSNHIKEQGSECGGDSQQGYRLFSGQKVE